ncbi:MAG: hypothetical protein ABJC19_04335 [Gemmatimonadota bacterium]
MSRFLTRRARRARAIPIICLLAIACGPETPTGPASAGLSPTGSLAKAGGGDLAPIEAFDLDVRITGRFEPGSPITVVASARSNIDMQAGTLRITAPELESAKRSAWDGSFRVAVGAKVAPALEVPAGLARGQSSTISTTLTADRSGLYRVVVSAVAEGRESNPGNSIQPAVHKELWLLVDSAGGRAMEFFDPSVTPTGMIPQLGPWRKLSDRSSLPRGDGEARILTSDGSDHYRVVFYDSDSSAYLALPGLTAEFNVYTDDGFGGSEITDYGFSGTDAIGDMTIECGQWSVGQTYSGMLRFSNQYVVLSNIFPFYGVSGAGGYDACGTWSSAGSPYQIIAPSAANARVFATLTSTIPTSRSYFGFQRNQIPVKVYSDTGTSNYSAGADDIEMYGNAIWTAYGRFAATHEYGHALHEKALGGNAASGNCPTGGHRIGQLTNLQCAFSEGFADYHARAVGSLYFGLEGVDYTYGCLAYSSNTCTWYHGVRDGSGVEGAVASFLYSVTDASNDSHDVLTYPGSYVANVIKTCVLGTYLAQRRIDGVDYLSYCLEANVDATVRSTYFAGRTSGVTGIYLNTATKPSGWSAADVRQGWLWDLYRQ